MIELNIKLQPKQKEFRQSIEDFPVTFYGGAKGGGKSKGLRDILLSRRFKYPGTVGALFRRTYKELEGNHIGPLFREYPALRNYWNDSKKILTLPNKSTLEFCHCKTEKDVLLYQGREFHDLGIEEAGQWTEGMFRTLHGSNRSSLPGVKPRTALTGNPGGIGHAWLKRLFVQRRFKEKERAQDYNFIKAFVHDNLALLENNPEYLHNLEAEPNEALRKAHLYGDWDIHAGQFFSEINADVHLIKPFEIPKHWNRFGAYDFGFNHPAAFGWFACDEDANVYLYREFVRAQLRVDEYARELNKYEDTKKLEYIVAGWDCWVQKGVLKHTNAPTVAEEFSNHNIILRKATIDRIQGATQVRNFLAWQNLAGENRQPKLHIFDNCNATFECLTRMQTDPNRPEDVLKQDATEGDPLTGDDAYDMLRYGLMSRPWASEPLKKQTKIGSKEYYDDIEKRLEADIDRQADAQRAEELEEDMYAISETSEESEQLMHYVNKRKAQR